MKLLTVCGTRPEIIRLFRIIPKLDKFCQHILVHTGQSYDYNMSQVFFDELGIRKPDHFLGVQSDSFGEQVGKILTASERVMRDEKPDRLLVLGDTNSALSAFVAKRLGIPVYHLEAGNRCFDDRVPEEVNRRIIDHSSDYHLPYTERSRVNLLREGIASDRIFVVGNPIFEVLKAHKKDTDILAKLDIAEREYFLVTAHRQENVDDRERLRKLLDACLALWDTFHLPIIFSRHPRTALRMKEWDFNAKPVTFHEPFGFPDFLALERNAYCVLTDSGTVQEETCILKIPCVTLRDNTERPETIECGSNILAGVEPDVVMRCVKIVTEQKPNWTPPAEYLVPNVSDIVVKVVLGAK